MAGLPRLAQPYRRRAQPSQRARRRRTRRGGAVDRTRARRNRAGAGRQARPPERGVMRALAITSPGVAQVVERPEPIAGPGEVLLQVARVGLCGTDLSSFLGKNPLVSYPRVIGHEVAGIIESVGPGVTGWATGTPVAV